MQFRALKEIPKKGAAHSIIEGNEMERIRSEPCKPCDSNPFAHCSAQYAYGVVLAEDDGGSPISGTGIMIGPGVVLTAAHNLYDEQNPRRMNLNIQFIPAINGYEKPFGIFEIEYDSIYVPKSYISQKSKKIDGACSDDYGVFFLPDVWYKNRWTFVPIKIADKAELKGRMLQLFGYPYDKCSKERGNFELWGGTGKIIAFEDEGMLSHGISTSCGQSGSGLFVQEGLKQYFAVGIHVTGNAGFNTAIGISKDRYNQIQDWISRRHNIIHHRTQIWIKESETNSLTERVTADCDQKPRNASHEEEKQYEHDHDQKHEGYEQEENKKLLLKSYDEEPNLASNNLVINPEDIKILKIIGTGELSSSLRFA